MPSGLMVDGHRAVLLFLPRMRCGAGRLVPASARPDPGNTATRWSRHWSGGFNAACPKCRELGRACPDAMTDEAYEELARHKRLLD